MPCTSGTGSPASISPFGTSSTGNVTGTVMMALRTPALPAVTQNDVPPRSDVTFGRESGIQSKRNDGASTCAMPSSGTYVFVSRTRKS